MVSVSESAWPTRRTSDRIVVAMGRRLSIPPKDLIADAKQLEGPVPNMIDMEDEYELAPPNSSGDHREASEMDVLATLAPLDLPVRLHFLFERKEILYIGFRERHATIFNMLVRRPSAARPDVRCAESSRTFLQQLLKRLQDNGGRPALGVSGAENLPDLFFSFAYGSTTYTFSTPSSPPRTARTDYRVGVRVCLSHGTCW